MASSSGNDDDLTIPRAAINKMIKETLPNVRVANDARELVVNCCTEFIHLISSEANEICNKSEKKTISPEHVIQALESLGFGSYISEVKEVLQECKTVALKRRKASSRLENLGIPEEELLRQQQELFAKVSEAILVLLRAFKILVYHIAVVSMQGTSYDKFMCVKRVCTNIRKANVAASGLRMQQAAQQAQLAAASASASNQAGSSQDEDDEDDI
ncbi:PREDICTED: protein Dr1 [Chaetura pelagica]|nr:PREDICTED: protein Dr1 [Chaetura pelagica]